MRRFLTSLAVATALLNGGAALADQTIRVGVTPGPHAQIMEDVAKRASSEGLTLKVIEFSDYVLPNTALAQGDLDANSFQHQPYLDNQAKDRGLPLVSVAKTVIFPLGLYSKKFKSLDQVPDGASIAIPNDPTNGGRVLLLLQDKGVIKLKDGVGFKPTVADITGNPKKLKILELDAAQTPRSLSDVAAAAINTNYAIDAKIDPTSAILREDAKGPYVNLIAVRAVDKDKPWVKTLVETYQSPEIKAFIAERYKGVVLAGW